MEILGVFAMGQRYKLRKSHEFWWEGFCTIKKRRKKGKIRGEKKSIKSKDCGNFFAQ